LSRLSSKTLKLKDPGKTQAPIRSAGLAKKAQVCCERLKIFREMMT